MFLHYMALLGLERVFFSRHFILHLTNVSEVPSPTFTLVQSYDANDFEIFHYDMYRLKTPDEAYELGIEESFFNGVNLVEWPEKIQTLLPRNIWKIKIDIKDDVRIFSVEVNCAEKQGRLESI